MKMQTQQNAWIYCKIDAPEDTHGMLKSQRKQLMDYAEQMGFCVVGSSSDLLIETGQPRAGWEYFMRSAKEKNVNVLLIHSMSRIHRDTCQALAFLDYLDHMGITAYSPLEGKLDFSFRHIIGKMR